MRKPHISKIKNFVLVSSLTAFALLMLTLSYVQTADAATTVIIKKGDSINKIAKAYAREHNMAFDVASSKIIAANPSAYVKGNPDKLIIGARLVLPNTPASPSPSTKTEEASKTVVAPAVVAAVTAETSIAPVQAAAPVPSTAPAASSPVIAPVAAAAVVAPAVPASAAATPVVNWDSYIVMPIWAMCLLGIAFLMLLVRLFRRKPAPILDIDANEVDENALIPPKVNINLPLKHNTLSETASIELAEVANVIEPIAEVDVKTADSAHQHSADQTRIESQHAIEKTEGSIEITAPSHVSTDILDVIEPLSVTSVDVVVPKNELTEPVPAKNLGVTFANVHTSVGLTQAKTNSTDSGLPKLAFSHIDLSKFGIPLAKLTIHDQIEETEKTTQLNPVEPSTDVVSEQDKSIDASIAATIIPTESLTLPDLDLGNPPATDTAQETQADSSESVIGSDEQIPTSETQTAPDVKPAIIQHSDLTLKSAAAFMSDSTLSQGNKSVDAPTQATSSSGVDLDVSGFMRRFSHQVPPEPMSPAIDFEDLLDRTHLQAWLNQRTPEEVLMCAQDAHDENYDDIAEVMLADVLFRGDAEQCSVAARLRRLWTAQRYR